ncbi:uncharacterized protein Z518_03843 [Rhinocladiella mackenziei CBS 650.93]|uniref:Mitotic checkpoint regulator, MAD2B-interacting-domain-containing protein n=1 Tax=Rhinocladiella mackenziei CBS 650.93 TaxID=1442369 RepID=A0A0D2J9S0_9EURO|nr:uncharacterized protein Z518_03843 [Rhinocladiella mackenziei CBS 650.93]KIX05870.1 hypothetical protein Z518_03843 [Rhinocladiella mackenziei CBS 650.93]
MSLVAYSDSEGSEGEEKPQTTIQKPAPKPSSAPSNTNFAVNKADPRKIQVRLQDQPTNDDADGEPAPKRPRVGGGGAFRGFNAMLPAPKRDSSVKTPAKPITRKVFSLKTGVEPGFSRESDAEVRQLFPGQEVDRDHKSENNHLDADDTIPSVPQSMGVARNASTEPPIKGNVFMFKPLSVARNIKKPKRKADAPKPVALKPQDSSKASIHSVPNTAATEQTDPTPLSKKVSLFSMHNPTEPEAVARDLQEEDDDEEEGIIEVLHEPSDDNISAPADVSSTAPTNSHQPQTLDSIASDLNLSKAERRQLFGRHRQPTGTAINVVNFNTDQEYAANEALRASGEQIQHNPVRAIAPGKHSLKQLVSAATGQKEALEDSFATGRRNKKEAGSKYGW